jgi:ABC-type transport system involved in Fe-S cluster assembly fused permease/ATPase subunit
MCFDHLLGLSLAFHTKRKTGEVLRILDRSVLFPFAHRVIDFVRKGGMADIWKGHRGSAINNIFQTLVMNVSPVVFDIVIATREFLCDGTHLVGWVLISYRSQSISSLLTVSTGGHYRKAG